MKALQQLIAAERHTVDDDLHLEINTSRNPGLRRGVKRRCFALEADDLEDGVRGRSFLETQWESEVNGRRREFLLPAALEEYPVRWANNPRQTSPHLQ